MGVTAPRFEPSQRDPTQVAPAGTYRRHDPVWVYRNGEWHTGVVDGSSAFALLVTYQQPGARGTVVDTVTPEYVVPHTDPDRAGGDR
jgi:hypothetical protein